MALGARLGDILPLVLQRGVTLIAAGIGIGTVAAIGVNRTLIGLLTEVRSLDPAVLAAAALVILVTALVACVGPALKAARVDPLVALRNS